MMNRFPSSLRLLEIPPLLAGAALLFLGATVSRATTSPYMTDQQTDIPLNQATDDTVNGLIPTYSGDSHTPPESGSIASLSDATSANAPSANVIIGPENTETFVAWDLGEADEGMMWQLERVDVWIAAFDGLRFDYAASFSTSLTENFEDFEEIPNSFHDETPFTENDNFNYIRFDFPETFVQGEEADQDQYVVENFRYIRLNSPGVESGENHWQPRFVEVDVWAEQVPVPEPGTYGLLAGLAALAGVWLRRRRA